MKVELNAELMGQLIHDGLQAELRQVGATHLMVIGSWAGSRAAMRDRFKRIAGQLANYIVERLYCDAAHQGGEAGYREQLLNCLLDTREQYIHMLSCEVVELREVINAMPEAVVAESAWTVENMEVPGVELLPDPAEDPWR